MQNDTGSANFWYTAEKIVYFVSSVGRGILTQERVAKRTEATRMSRRRTEVPRVVLAQIATHSRVKIRFAREIKGSGSP